LKKELKKVADSKIMFIFATVFLILNLWERLLNIYKTVFYVFPKK
jgi:hypothetical protein